MISLCIFLNVWVFVGMYSENNHIDVLVRSHYLDNIKEQTHRTTWLSASMKCKDSNISSKLFCLLLCVTASKLIKSSPFPSQWGGLHFYRILCWWSFYRVNENSHHFLVCQQKSFNSSINNNRYSIQTYKTRSHCICTYPFLLTQILVAKACLTALKLIKESYKHL